MLPLSMLGVYGIAATLAVVPAQVISNLGTSVIFPAYSRLQERSDFPTGLQPGAASAPRSGVRFSSAA